MLAKTRVASVLADARQFGQAVTIACSVTDLHWQAQALADIAKTLIRAGRREQAKSIAEHADAKVRSVTDPVMQELTLANVARTLADAGLHQQAESLARSITDPRSQAEALTDVARALAQAGWRMTDLGSASPWSW